MNTNSKIKVNLIRTYEYDILELRDKLKEIGYNNEEIDDDLLEETAIIEALEAFSCEMVYFEENINDLVGATTEII